MSVFIDEETNDITMTRGDSLRTIVSMIRGDEEYVPQDGDSVRFAVKRDLLNTTRTAYKDAEPLILKDIPIATMLLSLDPEDTKSLSFGDYAYDIEITYESGIVDTFIEAKLKLTPEVY